MSFKMKGYTYPGKSPLQAKKKKGDKIKKEQQGPVPEQNIGLQKSENPDTWVFPGKGTDDNFTERERIIDLDERSSFIDEDVHASGKKKTKQQKKDQENLDRERDIMMAQRRNRYKKK